MLHLHNSRRNVGFSEDDPVVDTERAPPVIGRHTLTYVSARTIQSWILKASLAHRASIPGPRFSEDDPVVDNERFCGSGTVGVICKVSARTIQSWILKERDANH